MKLIFKIFKTIFKVIKIFFALYLIIFLIGFILPDEYTGIYVKKNTITLFETLSSSKENIPLEIWASLLINFGLILWFGTKTLWRFISIRGDIKRFWNDL